MLYTCYENQYFHGKVKQKNTKSVKLSGETDITLNFNKYQVLKVLCTTTEINE